MKLYTWWRSQASFRVRIALRLKGLDVEMIFVDLSKDEQLDANYRAINPEMVLPTLIDGDGPPLVQSLSILEYLEERYPEPRLLPMEPHARAHVRALALRYWLDSGTRVIEEQLSRDSRTGRFCYGDGPTIADICLVAHLTSAKMLYDCNLGPYPTAQRIFETCMQLDAFINAHPFQQPDAPKTI